MPLITVNVPSLHNGVSQQAPTQRFPDQAEAQENGWASLADGLLKRPPTEHIAELVETPGDSVYVHPINRDVTERYIVVATTGQLRVFNAVTGEEIEVEAPYGWGYLDGVEDFSTDLSMTTVADYTFVVNRKISPQLVELDEESEPIPGPEGPRVTPPSRGPKPIGLVIE